MGKSDYQGPCFADLLTAVPGWESEYRVRVVYVIGIEPRLKGGAYVEVVLVREGCKLPEGEVFRYRGELNLRKAGSQASQMMHATFMAFQALDQSPWLWPVEKRRSVVVE